MPSTTRRRLLVSTGIAALTGSVASAQESSGGSGADQGELSPDELPDDVATVLGAVPTTVGDQSLQTIQLLAPTEDDAEEGASAAMLGFPAADLLGLDAASVDRAAVGVYEEYTRQVVVATGSFGEDDVDTESSETGLQNASTHVEDGLAILAAGQSGTEDALDATTDAADDESSGALAAHPMAALLDPVTDEPAVTVSTLDAERATPQADVDTDAIEFLAHAQRRADETSRELTFVFLFESADDADRSTAESLVESGGGRSGVEEASYESTGRRIVATARTQLPEHQLPDDSPDLHFTFAHTDDGTVQIEATGDQAADPDNLQLRVDGEPVDDAPWSDRGEPVESGTTFELSADLFSTVTVEWIDPNREDVSHTLGEHLIGAHGELFSEAYDASAEELTVTFEADATVDASTLELVHRSADENYGEAAPEPLSDRVEQLSTGTELVVEDVGYGDSVQLRVDGDATGLSYVRSVYRFRAEPPGEFQFTREDGRSYLVYRGDDPQPAEHYRITTLANARTRTAKHQPAAVQWADEYETVEPGDRLELEGLEIGTSGRVEWVGGDSPARVGFFRVQPQVEFSASYDEAAGEVELSHESGEALDADELSVTVHRGSESSRQDDAFEEYDEVASGDSTVLPVPEEPAGEDASRVFVLVRYGSGGVLEYVTVDAGSAASAAAA